MVDFKTILQAFHSYAREERAVRTKYESSKVRNEKDKDVRLVARFVDETRVFLAEQRYIIVS